MATHSTSVNNMGAITYDGSTYTTTGMKAEDHMHISQDFIARAGIVSATDLAITQNGSPDRSVNVAAGTFYIENPAYTANSVSQNRYWRGINDDVVNVAINTNTSGNPRITSIFAKLNTSATPDGDASNVITFVAIDGTAGATPVAPTAPVDGNAYLRLADVTCANGFTQVLTANIADKRVIAYLTNGNGGVLDSFMRVARIINGSCKFSQGSVPNLSSSYQYGTVEMFQAKGAGTAVSAGTITQTTAANAGTSGSALKLAGVTLTGSGIVYAKYRMCASDAKTYKNQYGNIGISVYHDTGSSVNYQINVNKANSADDFSAVTAIGSSTSQAVASATPTTVSVERLSLGDCSNGLEIEVVATCGAVTTKNFEFADWTINKGDFLLPISIRTYGQEMLESLRYAVYYTNYYAMCVIGATDTSPSFVLITPVPMRAAPMITYPAQTNGFQVGGVTKNMAGQTAAATSASSNSNWVYVTESGVSTGLGANRTGFAILGATLLDARL